MKLSTRVTLVIMVCLFALPLMGVGAQEQEEVAPVGFPDEMNGFVVQPALSGEFVSNDDDTYTLLLESATDFNSWIVVAPELFTANHSLAEFAGDWSFNEEISAAAVLQLSDMTVNLTLTTPVYFLVDGTFSYTVVVDEIITESAGKGGPSLPETFESATLLIQIDAEFANGYLAARQARLLETRPEIQDPCAPFSC